MHAQIEYIDMEKSVSDEIVRELEETRIFMERLKDDYRTEKQRSENLEKFQSDSLHKLHEAETEIEKLSVELNIAKGEAARANEMIGDLKSNLREKESIVKDLSHRLEQAKTCFKAQAQELRTDKEKLLSALDEANIKIKDQDGALHAMKDEVEALKKQLSVSHKKCMDAEVRAKAPQEIRLRDDLLLQFELEKNELQERFKWKNEQFQHLEEAHKKLQDEFKARRKEWETERNTMLDATSSLHTKLELTNKFVESIQSELQRCNHALVQEEKKRKLFELQLAESKNSYENIFSECEVAKTSIEYLNAKWEKEIDTLRNLVAMKEALLKEAEYSSGRLQQENHDLKGLVKELQESQISQAGSVASLSKLRQKLKGLEQAHKDCSMIMNAKECEWSYRLETLVKELEESKSELNLRREQIGQLEAELDEASMSLERLKKKEDMSLLVTSLELECRKLQLERADLEAAMKAVVEKKEERIAFLTELLKQKNECLLKTQEDIKQHSEARALLAEKAQELEDQGCLMREELQTHKEMVKEFSLSQEHIREKALEKEHVLTDNLKETIEAFDKTNLELMQIRGDLLMKDKIIDELQHEVAILEVKFTTKDTLSFLFSATMAEQCCWGEKEGLTEMVEKKDEIIKHLQQEVLHLEQGKVSMTNKARMLEEMILLTTVLSEFDNHMRDMLGADVESDISNLKQKLLHFEKLVSDSKRNEHQALIVVDQLSNEVRAHTQAVEKLKTDKSHLSEEVSRLTAIENSVLYYMEEVSHKIGQCVRDDSTALRSLELVLDKMGSDVWATSFSKMNESSNCNGNKMSEARIRDGRSPLKDLNG